MKLSLKKALEMCQFGYDDLSVWVNCTIDQATEASEAALIIKTLVPQGLTALQGWHYFCSAEDFAGFIGSYIDEIDGEPKGYWFEDYLTRRQEAEIPCCLSDENVFSSPGGESQPSQTKPVC